MTHKLFHDDVNIREFDADVVKCEPLSKELRSKYEGGAPLYAVWLDKTAFYAEAGGQPADHGTLGGANVLDVQEDETGDIYHVTAAPLEGSVHGALDWTRRFSNMQQHGGQHLISWAVHKYLGGYTFGLHTGAQECTIDTDLKEVPSRETLDMLENAVNGLIWQDLPVHQWFPSDEELKTLPLRKKPTVSENIRIVMTGDVECVACCGTHPTSSGQIGLVTILGAHPARGKVRISFLCGGRAHARLRAEADACREAGAMLSATYETLAQETRRVLDNAREQAHVLSEFRRETFCRLARVIGADALERLKNAHVVLFGVGGVGGFAAEALARSGVGEITLIDGDDVARSNINRQVIALNSTIGRSKVEVARERLLDINPNMRVNALQQVFLPGGEVPFGKDVSYVIDAIDTVAAKVELVRVCREMDVPLISCMGTGNKLDPTLLRVSDIFSTEVCPLCRVMRHELRKRGIDRLNVVYSPEPPRTPIDDGEQAQASRRSVPGSTMFVPPVAGIMLAREVVLSIVGDVLADAR